MLFEALSKNTKLDELFTAESKDPSYLSAQRMVRRILRSRVLKRVLCKRTNFRFTPNSTAFVRIDRAELPEFDALALGLFVMSYHKGQLVVDDIDFYGRDMHTSLIDEGRLIAKVKSLKRLERRAPLLKDALMGIENKSICRAKYSDAVELAEEAGLIPNTNEWNDEIKSYMS